MKKFVFLLVALFSLSVVFAQDISYGLKAGVNYGATKTTDADYNASFNPVLGPAVGVFAQIGLGEYFAIQPELQYFPSGSKQVDDYYFTPYDDGIDYDVKNSVNYFNIPIMAQYMFTEGLALEAGPYVGFLLSAKSKGTVGGVDVDEDTKDGFESMDYGVGVGAAYALDNGVFFNLRYYLGLADLHKEAEMTETKAGEVGTADFKVQNRILQFSVGYKFM